MSFIVTGMDIPANCFRCPLDKGVWKPEQDPFILCCYTKEIVRYDDVPTDRRLPCCGLKEMPEKHGRLIDGDALMARSSWYNLCGHNRSIHGVQDYEIASMETIVEAEG